MKFDQHIRNFLLLLFPAYYVINFYQTESIVSQACLLVIILISGIYMVKSLLLKERNHIFFDAWTLLLILNIAGFIIKFDLSPGDSRDMFRSILLSMLTFYPFYYFSRNQILKARHLFIFLLIMVPVYVAHFYNLESKILIDRISENRNVVNNMAYPFVLLMPYIFLIKRNKLISGALLLILIFFVIVASKRGALIAGTIGLLMYFYYTLTTIEKRYRFISYLFVFVMISSLVAFAYKTYTSNEFFMGRMNSILEGQYSGRDRIYSMIFNTWYWSENLVNFIFGFGFAASIKITGTFAHNDWLELLANFGLVGVSLYLFLFYSALMCCINKRWLREKRILMITITGMWFFISLVSMTYTSVYGFLSAILLGYLIGSKQAGLE